MDKLGKYIEELKTLIEDKGGNPFADDPFDNSVELQRQDLREIRELLIEYLILKNKEK